jgi:pyrroloquinoline quinone (PQQ) biosynthesis protein C
MSLVHQHTSPDQASLLAQLSPYPQHAADTVRPLLMRCTIDGYKHFLYMMYHYTKDSENKLHFAAEKSPLPELKQYFNHMAKEERGHYLLALKDYEALGGQIDTETVPESVKAFNQFWYKLGQGDCNEFLGALYVFESVASLVGDEIKSLIMRLKLKKTQCRWLSVHAEADEGHGQEAADMCAKYIQRNPQALIKAAAEASQKWSAVFVDAFND